MASREDLDLEAFERSVELLEAVSGDRGILAFVDEPLRERFLVAAGQVSRPMKSDRKVLARAKRKAAKEASRAKKESMLNNTGIRRKRAEAVFRTPHATRPKELESLATENVVLDDGLEAQCCYVCKDTYREIHHFYDQMCPSCAELNWEKRFQTADLTGRTALLTGGRLKIGFQIGVLMLRAGCHLVVTTRFPRDAAERYRAEPEYEQWKDRLEIFGLDLRHTPSVEAFSSFLCDHLERLDFIISNACQTVRRPAGFYGHLMEREQLELDTLEPEARHLLSAYEAFRDSNSALLDATADSDPTSAVARGDVALFSTAGIDHSAALSQVPLLAEDHDRSQELFPTGELDQDLQQVDLRENNSWRLRLAEVPTVELLEVQLVNAVAPFVLNARLKPLMLRHPSNDKHIINVSAMEGQFYRAFKTDRHPHTNMAKAALNMMTRTSAPDYARDGIHMNSVDTGWVTDEDPAALAEQKRDMHRFHPPLDIVDGAARVTDPIFDGFNTGNHQWGKFFKDYKPANW